MRTRSLAPFAAVLLALCAPARSHAQRASQDALPPDLLITSVMPGAVRSNRFCVGSTNRLYVTVRRQGGASFAGPISVWLSARSATGDALPASGLQRIDYVTGASSWLVIFRDVPVASDWRARDAAFAVVVNPEVDGTRPIAESNYNNNSYTLPLKDHTDWSRRCS
jgi:hypothetical protein